MHSRFDASALAPYPAQKHGEAILVVRLGSIISHYRRREVEVRKVLTGHFGCGGGTRVWRAPDAVASTRPEGASSSIACCAKAIAKAPCNRSSSPHTGHISTRVEEQIATVIAERKARSEGRSQLGGSSVISGMRHSSEEYDSYSWWGKRGSCKHPHPDNSWKRKRRARRQFRGCGTSVDS